MDAVPGSQLLLPPETLQHCWMVGNKGVNGGDGRGQNGVSWAGYNVRPHPGLWNQCHTNLGSNPTDYQLMTWGKSLAPTSVNGGDTVGCRCAVLHTADRRDSPLAANSTCEVGVGLGSHYAMELGVKSWALERLGFDA